MQLLIGNTLNKVAISLHISHSTLASLALKIIYNNSMILRIISLSYLTPEYYHSFIYSFTTGKSIDCDKNPPHFPVMNLPATYLSLFFE